MSQTISTFTGQHYFLSNFYPVPVSLEVQLDLSPTFEVLTFPTAEHAFQAIKVDPSAFDAASRIEAIRLASTPGRAKRLGRAAPLRQSWDLIRVDVMRATVRAKFSQNPDLARRLVATGDAELVEGNHWGDTFWGVDTRTGLGENNLGKLLMELREEMRKM